MRARGEKERDYPFCVSQQHFQLFTPKVRTYVLGLGFSSLHHIHFDRISYTFSYSHLINRTSIY